MNPDVQRLVEADQAAINGRSSSDALDMEDRPPLERAVLDYPSLVSIALPPRRLLLPFLPEGGQAMVFGPRGIGKTFCTHALAAAITTGENFLRWGVSQTCGVLCVDGEMTMGETRDRMTALLPKPPEAPLYFLTSEWVYHTLHQDLVLTSEDVRNQILDILEARPAIRVLILDNISCLFSGIDEDKKRDWEPIAAWLVRLRHRGIATVLVHHSGKGGQQRGTSGREDSLDTVIQLHRPTSYVASEGCHFELTFTKSRSAVGEELTPLDVKLQAQEGQLAWTWKTLEKSKEDQVRELMNDGMTSPKDISAELNISKGYASKLMKNVKGSL